MPLKTLAVKTTTTSAVKSSTKIPVFVTESREPSLDLKSRSLAKRPHTYLADYCDAVRAKKAAEAVIAENEPMVKAEALEHLFETNVASPLNPVSTVRMLDKDTMNDATPLAARVSCTAKYSVVGNVEAVDELLESMGKDINDFVQQRIAAKFDDKVFLSKVGDDKGEFSKRIYDMYRKAMEATTAEAIRKGLLPLNTECPLATFEVATVREDFHNARWSAFPTVEDQQRVSEVIKNTVTATVE